MSRLDSFIRRLTAQRDILNHIAIAVAALDGPILELGLGNGRTYDHLRATFPGRKIIAFDREVRSHGPSTPPADCLILGEIEQTALRYSGIDAALLHADIGTGYDDKDAVTLSWLPQLAADLLASGGFAVSGLPLQHPDLSPQPLPAGVKAGRYFIYRRA